MDQILAQRRGAEKERVISGVPDNRCGPGRTHRGSYQGTINRRNGLQTLIN
jgi:hypothetical protein